MVAMQVTEEDLIEDLRQTGAEVGADAVINYRFKFIGAGHGKLRGSAIVWR